MGAVGKCLGLSGVVIAVIVAFLVRRFSQFHIFDALVMTSDDANCELVKGGRGLEDLAVLELSAAETVDRKARTVVLFSADDRAYAAGVNPGSNFTLSERVKALKPEQQGFITVVDMSVSSGKRTMRRVNVSGFPKDTVFVPHGVSVSNPASRQLLVVMHTGGPDMVAVFTIVVKKGKSESQPFDLELEFEYSISDPVMAGLNDVAAVDTTSFYTTRFTYSEPGTAGAIIELLFNQPLTYVIYCTHDPIKKLKGQCSIALETLRGPNGVTVATSPSGKRTVYVAELFTESLLVCNPDPRTGALTVRQTIPLGTAPDNIEYEGINNRLYIGCHPKVLLAADAMQDRSGATKAPAQVIAIDLKADGSTDASMVKTIWLSGGERLGAVSVGAVVNTNELVMGTFIGMDGTLICKI